MTQLVNVGHGNVVVADQIVAIVALDSLPVKRHDHQLRNVLDRLQRQFYLTWLNLQIYIEALDILPRQLRRRAERHQFAVFHHCDSVTHPLCFDEIVRA